ncbi:hypothetical protein ADILRU_2016 [Leifsonia rubra CMS 76R]|nr:hypothetical protein ADILRU_2016 [Leifsonia rubra CMS 76R]
MRCRFQRSHRSAKLGIWQSLNWTRCASPAGAEPAFPSTCGSRSASSLRSLTGTSPLWRPVHHGTTQIASGRAPPSPGSATPHQPGSGLSTGRIATFDSTSTTARSQRRLFNLCSITSATAATQSSGDEVGNQRHSSQISSASQGHTGEKSGVQLTAVTDFDPRPSAPCRSCALAA